METATLRDESAPGREHGGLTVQARSAYQEKRTKECIDLTNRILLAEPANPDALALRDAVQADIQRDLNDARALLDDSRKIADGQKYRKAAEIILLKILYLDSTHAEAKQLLADAKGSAAVLPASPSVRISHLEETSFTASPQPVVRQSEARGHNMSMKLPLTLAGVVLLGGGIWFFTSQATGRAEEPQSAARAVSPAQSHQAVLKPDDDAGRAVVKDPPSVSTAVQPAKTAAAIPPLPVPPVPTPRTIAPAVPVAAVTPPPKPGPGKDAGALAVNSAMATDIYLGGKYLGSTPTTLPLSPGRYAVEYRHGDLRTVMNHEIKPNETVTAFVTFETTVQINARPWANVFVEGAGRRSLGQTPLSSVRVPIGSQLTFENPQFPPKSHRVTETDSAIQVVFP